MIDIKRYFRERGLIYAIILFVAMIIALFNWKMAIGFFIASSILRLTDLFVEKQWQVKT